MPLRASTLDIPPSPGVGFPYPSIAQHADPDQSPQQPRHQVVRFRQSVRSAPRRRLKPRSRPFPGHLGQAHQASQPRRHWAQAVLYQDKQDEGIVPLDSPEGTFAAMLRWSGMVWSIVESRAPVTRELVDDAVRLAERLDVSADWVELLIEKTRRCSDRKQASLDSPPSPENPVHRYVHAPQLARSVRKSLMPTSPSPSKSGGPRGSVLHAPSSARKSTIPTSPCRSRSAGQLTM